jgi:hypothetical protein
MAHILVATDENHKWICKDKGARWTDDLLEGVVGLFDVSRNQDGEVFA